MLNKYVDLRDLTQSLNFIKDVYFSSRDKKNEIIEDLVLLVEEEIKELKKMK